MASPLVQVLPQLVSGAAGIVGGIMGAWITLHGQRRQREADARLERERERLNHVRDAYISVLSAIQDYLRMKEQYSFDLTTEQWNAFLVQNRSVMAKTQQIIDAAEITLMLDDSNFEIFSKFRELRNLFKEEQIAVGAIAMAREKYGKKTELEHDRNGLAEVQEELRHKMIRLYASIITIMKLHLSPEMRESLGNKSNLDAKVVEAIEKVKLPTKPA